MIDLLGILTGQDKFAAGDPLDDRYYGLGGWGWGSKTKAGEDVTPQTAMGYSAAYAATVLLSGTAASLPLNIMRKQGEKREVASDHPAQSLLKDEPNEHSTATAWMVRGVAEQINWDGGFYCEIERNRLGEPVALWPIHPSRVRYEINDQNRLIYLVMTKAGYEVEFQKDEIFHVPGRFTPDGIGSIGVVRNARESIGLGMATERHGAATFGNGCRPTLAVKLNETKLTPEARNNFRTEWMEMHSGAANAGRPPILDGKMELQTFSWSAEDSQFLQTRQHNIEEVARWYGTPPHMIGHLLRSTYSNIEFQGIEFVIYSLMPWLNIWEAEIKRKLITPEQRRQGYYAKFNVNGLMRGDSKARSEFYSKMIEKGIMSPNEARELEDMNPYEGGDIFLVPMNMVTPEEAAKPEEESESQALPPVEPQQNSDAKNATLMALSARLQLVAEIEARSATKAAGDSKKFLEWMGGFYGGHVDTMRKKLSAPFALAGADVEAYVTKWIDHSKTTLAQIYDTAQPADFQNQVKTFVYGCLDEVDQEALAIYESGTH